ncbi:MAG: fumarate hydratase C-terminal domain-containing protein [Spirochaetaceae bacterium]|jgi:fumarate hydratase subunit beta|nr:fumarate hydratase C-terminal domain-containing protein [Spirochaetaceae bacterium]
MLVQKLIHTPLTKDAAHELRAGDIVELTGEVFTARDAAHKRIAQTCQAGSPPPLDLSGQVLFYAGPCPAPPGRVIGPIAATTSARMDGFLEMMYRYGLAATIGKGERGDAAARLCKQYGGVYFLSVGGAAALTTRHIRGCSLAAYDDLGTEAIRKLTVENLRLIVGIDSAGHVFQPEEIRKYRTYRQPD